jgi:hypothetical protein
MKLTKSDRGFEFLNHDTYENKPKAGRLASQSSAIGDYEDSLDRPGTSFLWIGNDHHLNREEVRQFVAHLTAWLKTGSLKVIEMPEPEGVLMDCEKCGNSYYRTDI